MKKTTLKLALVTLLVATMLSGCSIISGLLGGDSLDPELIVDEELQSFYFNEHSENYINSFVDVVTLEDLENRYYENIAAEAQYIAGHFGIDVEFISDETSLRLIELTEKLSSNIKYEITGSESTGDDYVVTVSVEPILTMTSTFTEEYFDEYAVAVSNDAEMLAMDEATLSDTIMNDFLDVLDEALNAVEYGDAVEVEIDIDVSDDGYEVKYDAFHMSTIEYSF